MGMESGDHQKEFKSNKSEGFNSSRKKTTKTKTQPAVSARLSGVQHAKETTPDSKAAKRGMRSRHTKTVARDGGEGGEGSEGERSGRESMHKRTAAQSPGTPSDPRLLDAMPAAHDILATQVHIMGCKVKVYV